jgi:hypothetical protein
MWPASPTETIFGRPGLLRGTALGLPNLANYLTLSLLDTDGISPRTPRFCDAPLICLTR